MKRHDGLNGPISKIGRTVVNADHERQLHPTRMGFTSAM
jgi:hypothetical protein